MTTLAKRPPIGLGPAGRRLWKLIVSEYQLEPPDYPRLETAARMADEAEHARQAIEHDGRYSTDKLGRIVAHPGLSVETRARTLLLRSLREMGVDVNAPAEIGRPPALAARSYLRGA